MSFYEKVTFLAHVATIAMVAGFGWHLGKSIAHDLLALVDLGFKWLRQARRPVIFVDHASIRNFRNSDPSAKGSV